VNPLSIWIILELNIVIFLLIIFLDSPHTNTETSVKYFIVQATSSRTIVWGVVIGAYSRTISRVFISVGILLKLGASPLHLWYLNIVQKVSWVRVFLLSTVQKILPLFFWGLRVTSRTVFLVVVMSRLIRVMALSQCLLKRVLGYSRVFNMSFMLARLGDTHVLALFFGFYTLTMGGVAFWGLSYNIRVIYKNYNNRIKSGAGLLLLLLSLGGVPPFLGFWAKLLVIGRILGPGNYIIIVTILVFSAVILVVYLHTRLTVATLKQSYNLWPLKFRLSNALCLLVTAPAPLLIL
jgi:NADH-ubiquinone oxidoreductase chain 2